MSRRSHNFSCLGSLCALILAVAELESRVTAFAVASKLSVGSKLSEVLFERATVRRESISMMAEPTPQKMSSSSASTLALEKMLYVDSRDKQCLQRICKDVYGGEDYLPSMMDSLLQSGMDYPLVLRDSARERVLALGNIQILEDNVSWLQAVRVDPEEKGKGYGKAITEALAIESKERGAITVLSSTHYTNLPMKAIFKKVGFAMLGSISFYPPYDVYFKLRRSYAVLADAGPRFIKESGLEAALAGGESVMQEFEACHDVAEAAHILKQVELDARAKDQMFAPFVMGFYRLHGLKQPTFEQAFKDGHVWIRKGPSVWCVAVAWRNRDLNDEWSLSVATSDAQSAHGAMLIASRALDAPMMTIFNGVDVVQCFPQMCSDLKSYGHWELYRRDM